MKGERMLPHSNGKLPPRPVRATRRVLVADGDASLRHAIGAALRRDGHDVLEAKDGIELVALLERMLMDEKAPGEALVVVAGMETPGLTGLDVLVILRCAAFQTPVIVLSPDDDLDSRTEAQELGAIPISDRPLDIDALRAAVRAA
jgi:DNA-binding response OmpR family regulator